MAKFKGGMLLATPGARGVLEESGVSLASLFSRHLEGDWGSLCKEDRDTNEKAVDGGGQILSVYGEGAAKVWVITDATGPGGERSATTALLPEEY